jgi:hypothetical protein
MSDDKPATQSTLDTLRQQYTNLCARYGNVQYQITSLQKDARLMEDELSKLTNEVITEQARVAKESANG